MPWHLFFLLLAGGRKAIQKRWRTRVNYQIRVSEVRVIDADGEQLGVLETEKALAMAEEQELDLVEVSPTARPPVCRIVDYGKFKYEKNKSERESRKKQHTIQVKEIKLRPKIEEHDYQFKIRHAEEFLEKHHKVKFTIIFRGRELAHRELGTVILERVEEDLSHVGTVERSARFEGRLMTMFMAPLATSKPQPKKAASAEKQKTKQKAVAKEEPRAVPAEESKAKPEEEPKAVEEEPKAVPVEESKAKPEEEPKAVPVEESKTKPKEEPKPVAQEEPKAEQAKPKTKPKAKSQKEPKTESDEKPKKEPKEEQDAKT